MNITAIEAIKTHRGPYFDRRPLSPGGLGPAVRRLCRDKRFSLNSIFQFAQDRQLGQLVGQFLMRRASRYSNRALNNAIRNPGYSRRGGDLKPTFSDYQGTHLENARIDEALSSIQNFDFGYPESSSFFGPGIASSYGTGFELRSISPGLKDIQIAVIGYGAAGILLLDELQAIGFRKITVFERAKPLGIWSRQNVYTRSRNNPRDLFFRGFGLDSAPGDGEE